MQPAFVAGFDVIRNVVVTVWDALSGVFQVGLALMRGDWSGAWSAMQDTATGLFSNLRELLASYGRFFTAILQGLSGFVTSTFGGMWDGFQARFVEPIRRFIDWIAPVFRNAFGVVQQVVITVWDAISGVFQVGLALIRGDWSGAWDAMKQTAVGLFSNLRELLDRFAGYFRAVWQAVGGTVTLVFTGIWDTLKRGLVGVLDFILDGINGTIEVINKLPGIELPSLKLPERQATSLPSLDSFSPTDTGDFGSSSGSVVSNAISSVDHGNRSVQVDRSIHGITLNVNTPAGADSGSIRDALLQALEDLAGQSDGIDEVAYAG